MNGDGGDGFVRKLPLIEHVVAYAQYHDVLACLLVGVAGLRPSGLRVVAEIPFVPGVVVGAGCVLRQQLVAELDRQAHCGICGGNDVRNGVAGGQQEGCGKREQPPPEGSGGHLASLKSFVWLLDR